MPTTVALVPFTHPDSQQPVAAGQEVTLGDEDYANFRADGKVAASEQEQKEHATPEAEGNYSARTSREDTTGTHPPAAARDKDKK